MTLPAPVPRSSRRTPIPPPPPVWPLERPPVISGDDAGGTGLLTLFPLLGAGLSMTVMLLYRGSAMAMVGASMMLLTIVASVVMAAGQRGQAVRRRRTQRTTYLAYLERCRSTLLRLETERAEVLCRAQPSCRELPLLARNGARLWERGRGDADFLRARVGTGTVRMVRMELRGDHDPLRAPDDLLQQEMQQLQRRFERVPGSPVEVDLAASRVVSVVGDRPFCEHVARLLLSQVTSLTSPADLYVALVVPPQRQDRWGWVSWLPHLEQPGSSTSSDPRPRIAPSASALRELVGEELARRREMTQVTGGQRSMAPPTEPDPDPPTLLVVCDETGHRAQHPLPDEPESDLRAAGWNATVVHLLSRTDDEPRGVALRVRQLDAEGRRASLELERRRGEPARRQQVCLDEWGQAECAALARLLAGRVPQEAVRPTPAAPAPEVGELLGLARTGAPELDRTWTARAPGAFLRVPIGVDDTGAAVEIDLKEAAASGMGPHGLCVGATGSGKSELLRTLVLSLLVSHPPDDLAMVLVDYKGGATFAPFASAPHVHGVITNLGEDAILLERVYASLAGEVRRRQEMLKAAGHLPDISAYRSLCREPASPRQHRPPMPHLLLIIDEFGELLSARPDFIELFLSIGRIGRSIGVHLLLSSQRIEAGKLRGLETHLSYRIGLRTLSAAESRTVLDTADAFSLPTRPGYGYLKVDTSVYRRFRAGYVSGPVRPAGCGPDEVRVRPAPFYGSSVSTATARGTATQPDGDVTHRAMERSVLHSVMTGLSGRDRVGPAIWLPPLPEQLTLDQVPREPSGPAATSASLVPGGGSDARRPRHRRVPLGLLDDPARQWQGPWELDLASCGNVLLVGGPGSGRSTLLRSLVASLARTYSPDDVVVYGVDATGSGLQVLESLPVVAGAGCRPAPELVRRVLTDAHSVLTRREAGATERGGGTRWGTSHADPDVPASDRSLPELDPASGPARASHADVVVLVDGFGALCEEHPDLVEILLDLLRRGPAHGVRLVCTVSRRHEVRWSAQSCFTTVFELRLSDPAESEVGRTLSQTLAQAPPGRCLLASGLFAQAALPRADGQADRESVHDGLESLVAQLSASTPRRARRVRVLPTLVTPQDVATSEHAGTVGLGLDEADFDTAVLDLDALDRHLLLLGDPGSGKTSTLRHVLDILVRQHTADDLVIALVDPRGTLRGQVPPEYLGGYAGSATLAPRLVGAVTAELEHRARQVGDAHLDALAPSPRVVVVADDYEALTAGGACPLQALAPFVPLAREIGLNLLLARRAHGASRGLFEPFLSAVRESDATALLFSADPAEGPLFGSVRASALPAGRARLVRRGRDVRTVQTVYREPR